VLAGVDNSLMRFIASNSRGSVLLVCSLCIVISGSCN
jgi:hypothetical protein